MLLKNLELRSFRNIRSETLLFNPGLNVLRGPNGQGKTNLVEGIHLLTNGKSFRTNENNVLIQHGQTNGAFLKATFDENEKQFLVLGKLVENRKSFTVNGKNQSTTILKKIFPTVLFSPESLMIVKESPSARRELVDDVAVQISPGFPKIYDEARKLLKQKNALLRQWREGKIANNEAHRLFHSITELFFKKSTLVIGQRLEVIKKILPFFTREFSQIIGDPLVEIDVDYRISGVSALGYSNQEILNAMYKRWEELQEQERSSGKTLVGPHRHDIQFLFNGQEARTFCSQGQQRAIILAFKLAQIRLHYAAHGIYPMLLLDDVLSELDRQKQDRFLNYLLETQSQIFLTTTDTLSVPEKIFPATFDVHLGSFQNSLSHRIGDVNV